ncbi:hypothetical protein BH23GEM5_BH23GEM5_10540 [soil metagenome]|jgi:hypothetical protein
MTRLRIIISSLAALVLLSSSGAAQELIRRVQFAPGSNSAAFKGSVVRGERERFVLHGQAGQRLQIQISSREDNAVFTVLQPERKRWLQGAGDRDDAKQWSGTLPVSGEYLLSVASTRGNTSYKLIVTRQ